MIQIVTAILILVSSAASVYHAYIWVIKPETALLYVKANMPYLSIELLSMFLGAGGLLLLFPYTFKVGGAFLITHSVITITCYFITKDIKGGIGEFILLQIPIFLVWAGYPLSVIEKFRNFFL